MIINSLNCVLKNVFYNLEKVMSGKTSDSRNLHKPLSASKSSDTTSEACNKNPSLASGTFLSRVRNGEALVHDKENLEIVKDYVRTKSIHIVEDLEEIDTTPTAETAVQALTKSLTEEIPVFGLKASLHASPEIPSFDNWKSVHYLKADQAQTEDNVAIGGEIVSPVSSLAAMEITGENKAINKTWRDLSVHLALRLIDHPKTPAEVLRELAKHSDAEVRAQVVDHQNTPFESIMQLIHDQDLNVRMSLAESYTVGYAVLEMLVDDENPYVSARAKLTSQRLRSSTGTSVIRNLFGLSSTQESTEVPKLRARA